MASHTEPRVREHSPYVQIWCHPTETLNLVFGGHEGAEICIGAFSQWPCDPPKRVLLGAAGAGRKQEQGVCAGSGGMWDVAGCLCVQLRARRSGAPGGDGSAPPFCLPSCTILRSYPQTTRAPVSPPPPLHYRGGSLPFVVGVLGVRGQRTRL